MTPPDSGERHSEREVTRRMEEACAAADHAGPYVTLCLGCVRKPDGVYLDSGLAQRILAALAREATHGDVSARELEALAAELRAIVERKP